MTTAPKTQFATVTLNNHFHHSSVNVRVPETWLYYEEDGSLDQIATEHEVYGRLSEAATREHEGYTGDPSIPGARRFYYHDKSAQARIRRIDKALCGMSDCHCGTHRPE